MRTATQKVSAIVILTKLGTYDYHSCNPGGKDFTETVKDTIGTMK